MDPTKYFEILNKIFGYGTPSARIWFVGIEDGGPPWGGDTASPESLQEAKYSIEERGRIWTKGYSPASLEDLKSEKNTVNRFMSYVVSQGSSTDLENLVIDKKANSYFQMNLRPLMRRHTRDRWPTHYKDLFGWKKTAYEKDVRDSFKSGMRNRRGLVLQEFWKQNGPHSPGPGFTVCFTVAKDLVEHHLKPLFDLPSTSDEVAPGIFYYKDRRVFVTKFFGGRGWNRPSDVLPLIQRAQELGLYPSRQVV